jgi:hypothetical protein
MVKRISPIRVLSFVVLAACGALCQSERSSADLRQGDGSYSFEVQRQEMRTWKSLPDAPSVLRPTQAEKFHTFADEARSALRFGAVGINAGMMRETKLAMVRGRSEHGHRGNSQVCLCFCFEARNHTVCV